MSSISVAQHVETRRSPNLPRDNRFFLAMSVACAIAVFAGFSRTYFLRNQFGAPALSVLLEIHGAVFTTWILYFVLQTALIADRRVAVHRRLGYAGAVLACGMFGLGSAVAYCAAKYGFRRPVVFAPTAEGGLFFSLVDIWLFGVLVAAGFGFRRQRQDHQRFMLMANVCALLPSAFGRLPAVMHPAALVFLFVLAGPLYDLFTMRRIHRAYLWSLLIFFFTVPPIRMLVGNSSAWYHFAHWLIT